ncbi:MAG: hypothetical protein HQM08_22865 [Candidatus Riflebacteria bacterium]|nr:hypothetical protein [Candidatus Riflebacteria bacterium]
MSDIVTFSDVMFDSEPIGLANSFSPLAKPVKIIIEGDSQTEPGKEIYFGLPTPQGEIMETKARVCSVSPIKSGFSLTVEVIEVDKAMASIAASILSGVQDSSNEGKQPIWGAGLKQTNGAYAILVNSPAGILNSAQLEKITELSKKGAGLAKLTHAQRIVLLMPLDQVEQAGKDLASVGLRVGVLHKGVRNIRACCGALCSFSQNVDAVNLAITIDKELYGRGAQFDIKIAISDCRRNCLESFCSDIGLIGNPGSYRIVVGGRGSQVPFRALVLQESVKVSNAPEAVRKIVDWYEKNAHENERFWKLLQRLGESEVSKYDFTSIQKPLSEIGDGIDEYARFHDQLARLAGLRVLKRDINLE